MEQRPNDHLDSIEYKVSVILLQVLEKLKEEPIASKLATARTIAGNDVIRTMQYVLPIVMQVELQVLKYHGYNDGQKSLVKFTQLIVDLEKVDSAIKNLHDILKSHYLPPLANPMASTNVGNNVAHCSSNHFANSNTVSGSESGSDSTINISLPSSH